MFKFRVHRFIKYFIVFTILIGCKAYAVQISDQPNISTINPPSANIMFILDNSESMDWEIQMNDTEKYPQGVFNNKRFDPLSLFDYAYIFNHDDALALDNVDSYSDFSDQVNQDKLLMRTFSTKKFWQTRCQAYNRLYYSPFAYYLPWPDPDESDETDVYGNADKTTPCLNPESLLNNDPSANNYQAPKYINLKEKYMLIERPNTVYGNGGIDLSAAGDGDGRDIELDDEYAIKEGTWVKNSDDSLEAVFKDSYHMTKDSSAKITYPFEVYDTGTYKIEVSWPYFLFLNPSGSGYSVIQNPRNIKIDVIDKEGNSFLNEKLTVDQCQFLKSNHIFEVNIDTLNKNGPDFFVVMENDNNKYMVADTVEIKYVEDGFFSNWPNPVTIDDDDDDHVTEINGSSWSSFAVSYMHSDDVNAEVKFTCNSLDSSGDGYYNIELKWPKKPLIDFSSLSGTPPERKVKVTVKAGVEVLREEVFDQYSNDGNIMESVFLSSEAIDGSIDVYIKKDCDPSECSDDDYTIYMDKVKFVKVPQPKKTRINNAHYITWDDANNNRDQDSGEELYLVNFEWYDFGSGEECYRQIYKLPSYHQNQNGNDVGDYDLGIGELLAVKPSQLPNRLRMLYDKEYVSYLSLPSGSGSYPSVNPAWTSPEDDLQNFANWMQYYRTKFLASKSAIANSIFNISDINIGFDTIHQSVTQEPVKINRDLEDAENGIIIVDDSDSGSYHEEDSGQWKDSNADVAYRGNSRYTDKISMFKTAECYWDASIETAGNYDLFIRWSMNRKIGLLLKRDDEAVYSVHKVVDGVESTELKSAEVNQNGDPVYGLPDRWNNFNKTISISADEIEKNVKVRVRLKRKTKLFNGSIDFDNPTSADAIKLVKQGISNNTDHSTTLLTNLYKTTILMEALGEETPLRKALKRVGQFYSKVETDTSGSELGTKLSPYYSKEEGGECQQAFAIILTDGYWDGDSPSVSDEDSDGCADTLADVAHKYYSTDLAPNLDNRVPTNLYDSSNSQHMVTYAVSFGQKGNIDYELPQNQYWMHNVYVEPDWPDITTNFDPDVDFDLSTPISPALIRSEGKKRMDDLFHATTNGHGLFFNATSPDEVIAGLRKVLEDIQERVKNTGAAAALNSNRLSSDLKIYMTQYYPSQWLGDIRVLALDAKSLDSSESDISVASVFASLGNEIWEKRNILTLGNDGASTKVFKPFNITSDDIKDSVIEDILGFNAATRDNVVNFIKGKTLDSFRQRTTDEKMSQAGLPEQKYYTGDFVHSTPVFYDGAIYAGGNDGMLHAFDSTSLKEKFAYVPKLCYENLPWLLRHDYFVNHRYFVDGDITIKKIGSGKDILVGGLRKGGKGYYGINISKTKNWTITGTNVETSDRPKAWEFPGTMEEQSVKENMGFSYSKPILIPSNLTGRKWIVLFGNGYNSINEKPVLFAIDPLTGECIAEIPAGDSSYSGNNGLSTPAVVDIDDDGDGDFVYAGDIKGNIWKFDIDNSDTSKWAVSFDNKPLFTVKDKNGNTQSITSRPGIARDCSGKGYMVIFGTGKNLHPNDLEDKNQQALYGIWDYGKSLGELDYGTKISVKDSDLAEKVSKQGGEVGYKLSGQEKRGLIEQKVFISSHNEYGLVSRSEGSQSGDVNMEIESHTEFPQSKRWVDDENTWTGIDLDLNLGSVAGQVDLKYDVHTVGWFFNLPETGERIFQDVTIVGEYAVAVSYVPGCSVDDPCASDGDSWFNEVESCNGTRPDVAVIDVTNDKSVDMAIQNDDGSWEYNDSIVHYDQASDISTICNVSRTKVPGMMFTPKILRGIDGGPGLKIFTTSQSEVKTFSEKRDRVGIFCWRER